ncbi:MAG: hypothetical protein LBC02_13105, partial [Planctomycetaceae bacterium]|nr:hypothetical protein [Planctomycetaceae bacterium]
MKEGFFSSKALLNIGLFFILVVGGVWWSQSSIKSSRPDDPKNSGLGTMFPEKKALARSWQDPFEPYSTLPQEDFSSKEKINYWKLKETFFQDRDKFCQDQDKFCHVRSKNKDQELLLMGVMVPSGLFGDRVERRQRLRVAVVSALAAGGYAPENGERLGYFPFTPPNGSKAIMVPYEFFSKLISKERRRSAFPSTFDRILVVWISDEHFIADPKPIPINNLKKLRNELLPKKLLQKDSTSPIINLLSCFCYLFNTEKHNVLLSSSPKSNKDSCNKNKITVQSDGKTTDGETNQWVNAPFYIFGPWSSTTLKAICKEIESSNKPISGNASAYDNYSTVKTLCDAKITFFNVFATAPLDLIMHIDNDKNDDDKLSTSKNELNYEMFRQTVGKFSTLFGTAYQNSRLERNWLYPTCSDSLVAETVAQELKRRGIDFDQDNIAMIAENDTLFGRSLPKIFRRIFERDSKVNNQNFDRFTYLRGLDGALQPNSNSNNFQNTLSETNHPSTEKSLSQRLSLSKNYSSKGNNQYDYLFRLRDTMRQDEYLSGKKFKAIGILGSDVYDKVILMQILRPAFPNAIFFTTDLDAELWESQHLPGTKNLIVGSSHGLQLHEKYQQGILPFRFSYQTALFQGILGATTLPKKSDDFSNNLSCVSRRIDDSLLAPAFPRLFEIGLNGPIDLSPKILNDPNEKIHPDSIICSPS